MSTDSALTAPLVVLDAVSKTYPSTSTTRQRAALMAGLLLGRHSAPGFMALDGVSLQVRRGASLALIGENGAGKSTLLKMVAGVIQPTTGQITVNGRVGALLELGAGFNPEYSGRENIQLSAALWGLSADEIAARTEGILAFADIGSHIDEPVKHYSSGMTLRLGFAIATAMQPDLLITDEVLAVGDEAFQRKCARWIESYLAQGGTLLLCSHVMYHVQKLCTHALWLHKGRVVRYGEAADVVQAYLASQEAHSPESAVPRLPAAPSDDTYRIEALNLTDGAGAESDRFPHEAAIHVSGQLTSPDGRMPHIAIAIVRRDGTPVFATSSEVDGRTLAADGNGGFGFSLAFDPLMVLPGAYWLRAHAMDPEALRVTDTVEREITVSGDVRYMGLAKVPYEWR